MSIHALVTGTLFKKPEIRTSKSGNAYCNFSLSVPDGEERTFVSCVAFGDHAERVARLEKGDSLAVTGSLKMTEWEGKQGETRHGLSVTVGDVMTLYEVKKKKGKPQNDDPGANSAESGGYGRGNPQNASSAPDFDDDINF